MTACAWDGCPKQARAHGYCGPHRYRAAQLGLIDTPRCLEPGCEQPHTARGLCSRHYNVYRHAGVWPVHVDGDPEAWAAAALVADARLRGAQAAALVGIAVKRLLHPDVPDPRDPGELLVEALRILEAS